MATNVLSFLAYETNNNLLLVKSSKDLQLISDRAIFKGVLNISEKNLVKKVKKVYTVPVEKIEYYKNTIK